MLKWGQFGRRQRTCDAFLILLYGAAYIVCIIITPYDDLLTYNSMRVPGAPLTLVPCQYFEVPVLTEHPKTPQIIMT